MGRSAQRASEVTRECEVEERPEGEILDAQMMRTLLANDRTYFAWLRTALGFVVVVAGAR